MITGSVDADGAPVIELVVGEYYMIDFPFDGRTVQALVSFVIGREVLIGTRILRDYRLEIDFPARQVTLDRVR